MSSLLMRMALDYFLKRLSEASTWAAIAAGLAGSLHVQFSGDFTKALISFGLAGSVLLGIMLKEGVKK